MRIEDVENSIVERLAPLTAPEIDIEVRILPEKESELQKAFAKPRITVQYHSSEFEKEGTKQKITNTATTQQTETIYVELIMQSQKLRGATGIYTMFEACRALLVGFKPSNCRKLFLVGQKFSDREAQVWTYGVTMGCETMSMEKPDELVDNLIKQIKALDATSGSESFTGVPDVPVITDPHETTSSTIKINIQPTTGANGYEFDISLSPMFASTDDEEDLYPPTGSIPYVDSWTFENLLSNRTYYIRLRGVNDEHKSANSNVLSINTNL